MYHINIGERLAAANNMSVYDRTNKVIMTLVFFTPHKDNTAIQTWIGLRLINNLNRNNIAPDNTEKIKALFIKASEEASKVQLF